MTFKVLGQVFRSKFPARVAETAQGGPTPNAAVGCAVDAPASDAPTHDDCSALLRDLHAREWVVFCEAPPTTIAKDAPAPLVKYLARYVSGAVISDGRLLEHLDGQVTFRAKNYRQGRRHVTLRLSGVEFTRRFALHILPSGLARVRRCGLMAAQSLAGRQARALLPIAAAPQARATPPSLTEDSASEPLRCPRCERGRLRLVKVVPRPARRALLAKYGLALSPHDSCPDTF